MKYIIIGIIKLYYRVIPEPERRVCIHAESCSRYVLRIAQNNGFIAGLKAYLRRLKSCNNDYTFEVFDNDVLIIKTKNGIILKQDEINPFIVKSIKSFH